MNYHMLIALLLFIIGCRPSPITVSQVISESQILLSDGRAIHYAGIDPLPSKSKWLKACKQANAYLLLGKKVKLLIDHDLSGDNFLAAYVYTPIFEGEKKRYIFVNAEMVRFGFAQSLPPLSDCRHPKLRQSLWNFQEQEAKPLQRGIWSKKIFPPIKK